MDESKKSRSRRKKRAEGVRAARSVRHRLSRVEMATRILGEAGLPSIETLLYSADDRHRMIAEAAYHLAEKRCFARGDMYDDASDDWSTDDVRLANAINNAGSKSPARADVHKRSN